MNLEVFDFFHTFWLGFLQKNKRRCLFSVKRITTSRSIIELACICYYYTHLRFSTNGSDGSLKDCGSSDFVPRPAVVAFPDNLLEIEILKYLPRPIESEVL